MAKDKGIDPSLYMEKPDKPARPIVGRIRLYTYMVLILLILGMYLWKLFAVQSLEESMENQRTEMIQRQQDALEAQAHAMLRMTAQPLAWAVRAEMMRDNLSQVDDYFRDFVKEQGVQSIFLIDKNNQVAVATNRKLEAQPADSIVSQTIRDTKKVVIEPFESGLRLGIPIMSFNEKIGILVVDYDLLDSKTPNPEQQ
jgi:hypothetical protein